ncbi:MAG: bifunctional DNA primase/helicase [Pseudomonadota bacterium]
MENSPAKSLQPFAPWDLDASTSDAPSAIEPQATHTTVGAGPTGGKSELENSQSIAGPTDQSFGSATTAAMQVPRWLPGLAEVFQKRRGLPPALCEQLGVWTPDRTTLAFDYRVNGEVQNTKLRRGKGNMPWRQPGKPLTLWNVDSLSEPAMSDEVVLITEGEIDACTAIHAGFTRVVSVPNGAQSGERGFDYLFSGSKLLPALDQFTTIVLAMDDDAKGREARDAMAVRIGDERCRTVVYPEGSKDLNEVLLQHGLPAVVATIESARPMWTDEVCKFADIPTPGIEQRYRLGFEPLDTHGFRITLPCFAPMVGPYASGKSVFARQLAVNLWRLHGWRFLLTEFEERAKPRFERDLRRHLIGKPVTQWTQDDIDAADEELNESTVLLRKKRRQPLTADRVLDRIEYAVKVYGVKTIIIDPMNAISHRVPPGQSWTSYMGEYMETLKEIADDYRLLMIPVVHVPKDAVEKRLGKGKILTLNDGEGTNNWGNKADLGLVFWRDLQGPTMMNVDKTKDHETMGKPALCELSHRPNLNSFRVTKIGDRKFGDEYE